VTRQPEGRGHLAPFLELLADITPAATDAATALTGLAAARAAAAYTERAELRLIQAARDGGATWQQIAAALGIKTRTGAQKRYADLSRRWPRPPAEDTTVPQTPPQRQPDPAQPAPAPGTARTHGSAGPSAPRAASTAPAPARPARKPGTGTRHAPDPEITPGTIGNGYYDIVKAPGHAESRAWHVLVGGQRAGLVRPTWHGERSRPGWEAVTNAGTALPATGTGRITAAGNARTRAAAAVSLLNALLREQENQRRKRNSHPQHEPGRRRRRRTRRAPAIPHRLDRRRPRPPRPFPARIRRPPRLRPSTAPQRPGPLHLPPRRQRRRRPLRPALNPRRQARNSPGHKSCTACAAEDGQTGACDARPSLTALACPAMPSR